MRTRAHVIADLGINQLERHILLCGHTPQRIQHDYGYDVFMTTYNPNGEIQQGWVYFQVKATSRLPLLKDGKTISWTISRRDLKLWLSENYPVILVIYHAPRDRAYWLDVQGFFSGPRSLALFSPGETINVEIPTGQMLDRRAIHKIARRKQQVHQQQHRRTPRDV
ncbi:MAG: DUF4365 domain-containing protein [Fimbriimonadales bacterium]